MRIRHNKKRNTAFVFESLIREATLAILKNDLEKKDKIIKIIKEHFGINSTLKGDFDCYRSLYANQSLDKQTSEKILKETRLQRRLLSPQQIFSEQTKLINSINKQQIKAPLLLTKLINLFIIYLLKSLITNMTRSC